MLNDFNLEMQHIKGENNYVPDLLSRINSLIIVDKVKERIEDLYNSIDKPTLEEITKHNLIKESYMELYTDNCKRIYIPNSSSHTFCMRLHDIFCHPGAQTLYYTIKKYIKINNVKNILYKITNSCKECRINKVDSHSYGYITGNLGNSILMKQVYIDHLGPFNGKELNKQIKQKKFWFLVLTEGFSKFTKVYLIEDLTPEATIKKISKYFKEFGIPTSISSDQGRTFTSNKFKTFCQKHNITLKYTHSYNPQANGLVERRNRTVMETLRMFKNCSLSTIISKAEIKLNLLFTKSHKFTPIQLFLKQNPLDRLKKDIYDEIKVEAKVNQNKMNEIYQKQINKRRTSYKYKPNDMVLIKNHKQGKIKPPYLGPYLITEVNKNSNSLLLEIANKKVWVNIKNVKPFNF